MNRLSRSIFRQANNFLVQKRTLQPIQPRYLNTSTNLLQKHQLHLTDSAKKRLEEILEPEEYLRVKVNSGGCSGFQYEFILTKDREDDDIISDKYVLTDEVSLELIKGSYVDYYKETIRSAFGIVNNPQATDGCSCGASFSIDINSIG